MSTVCMIIIIIIIIVLLKLQEQSDMKARCSSTTQTLVHAHDETSIEMDQTERHDALYYLSMLKETK